MPSVEATISSPIAGCIFITSHSASLSGGLTFASGPIETLEQYDGASVEVEELESIDIESVREPVRPVEAEPDTGE